MNQLQTDLAAMRSWIDAERAKADAIERGPWTKDLQDHIHAASGKLIATCNVSGGFMDEEKDGKRASFIASARTSNPLLIDMMLIALDGLEKIAHTSCDMDIDADCALQSMIAAWKEATK